MSARKPPSEPNPPADEADGPDASEWEQGQHTPEVGADAMTALVKESATRTPPAGVPLAGGKIAARTVKRAGTKGGKSGAKRKPTESGRTKRARTKTPVAPVEVTPPVDQNDIATAPVPKFEPEAPEVVSIAASGAAPSGGAEKPAPSAPSSAASAPSAPSSVATASSTAPASATAPRAATPSTAPPPSSTTTPPSASTTATPRAATPSTAPPSSSTTTTTTPSSATATPRAATPSTAPPSSSATPPSASTTAPPRAATPSTAPPASADRRPGSTTLSPTAFIRSSGDTVPPISTAARTPSPPRAGRSATKPPPLPLPRAAAAVALGNVPIEGVPTANADDEDSSALAAYLSMPIGEERRARKPTLPPPPPQEFPIEEEVAQGLPDVGSARKSIGWPTRLAIAGGAVVLVIVVLVFALGGHVDEKKPVAQAVESPTPVEQTVPAVAPPSGSAQEAVVPDEVDGSAEGSIDDTEIEIALPDDEGSAAVETGSGTAGSAAAAPPTDAGAGSATTGTTTTATAATTTTASAPPQVSKTRATINALLKNKDVVLEYDGRIGKNGAPASDQAAISKARASHAAGTQRLNAGDYAGALDNYRQALSHYPGYIGAYRGMGLAYERKGDKANALKALRMYVSVVPNATDVAALRKRIDALSTRQ